MSKYSEQVKQDAAKAAAYIRENGWCQRHLFLGTKCCTVGAVWKGSMYEGQTEDQHFARDYGLFMAVRDELNGPAVAKWNDEPGRTKEEVLAVFDRIANS